MLVLLRVGELEIGVRKKIGETLPTVMLWSIWKEQNSRIFENKASEVLELFESANWRLCSWLAVNKKFKEFSVLDFYRSRDGV